LLLSFASEAQVIRANTYYIPISVAVVTDTLLIDSFPNAIGAYSFRKLRTAYTGNCIRIRRSNDNSEQDIAFVSNYIDTVSMKTFVGANNGFIVNWYNQADTGRTASQSTSTAQPRIINSGSIDYQNNKVTGVYDGNDFFNLSSAIIPSDSIYAAFTLAKRNTSTSSYVIFGNNSSNALTISYLNSSSRWYFQKSTAYLESTSSDATTNRILMSGISGTGSDFKLYKNGSEISTNNLKLTITNSINRLGRYNSSTSSNTTHTGNIQEIIIYTSNQSSNRTGIERMLNRFYAIY
jgi:hypothetical protein